MISQKILTAYFTTENGRIKFEIFLTSFLILFLELALIRYLPAHITYFGYYTNFILLASFVGMGIGIMLARNKFNFVQLFPLSLLSLFSFISVFAFSVSPSSGELHFTNPYIGIVVPEILAVPFIFLMVAFVFICISQHLGRLFGMLPPLSAYGYDIVGSLLGIFVFTLFSWMSLGPSIWFVLVLLAFLLIHIKRFANKYVLFASCIMVWLILFHTSHGVTWSPYQKITLDPAPGGYVLYVNNISHQRFGEFEKEEIYKLPYELFGTESFDRILIIGSGTGTDVETALEYDVKQIDAVEIDPEIYKIGKELNVKKPYQSPKVSVYVDDARSFLQKTDNKYDLIVYGLPDSLVLAGSGRLRLESFLFTEESFEVAKSHLTEDGLMVMYNYYREPWLVQKLAYTVEKVFGSKPYVQLNSETLALIAAGPRLENISIDFPDFTYSNTYLPATDDWPFPYLKQPAIPWNYMFMLAFILTLSYALIHFGARLRLYRTIEPTYFFLGVAFMLLQTMALVRFSLLFGTTWLVNSLVFFAMLSFVLVAILVAKKIRFQKIYRWYALLAVSLLIQYLLPVSIFLTLPQWLGYIFASILILIPVFIANIIFSMTFKTSTENDINFGSNILGIVVGGVLEYTALLLGYSNLVWLVLLCYLLAFYIPILRAKRAIPV